jgi:hypothetical protein
MSAAVLSEKRARLWGEVHNSRGMGYGPVVMDPCPTISYGGGKAAAICGWGTRGYAVGRQPQFALLLWKPLGGTECCCRIQCGQDDPVTS